MSGDEDSPEVRRIYSLSDEALKHLHIMEPIREQYGPQALPVMLAIVGNVHVAVAMGGEYADDRPAAKDLLSLQSVAQTLITRGPHYVAALLFLLSQELSTSLTAVALRKQMEEALPGHQKDLL